MREILYNVFAALFQWGCFLIIACGILVAYLFAFMLYCIMILVYLTMGELPPIGTHEYYSELRDALAAMTDIFL